MLPNWTAPLQVVAINHNSFSILRLTRSRKAQAGGGVDDACACDTRKRVPGLRVKRLYGKGFGISHRTKVALSNEEPSLVRTNLPPHVSHKSVYGLGTPGRNDLFVNADVDRGPGYTGPIDTGGKKALEAE
jgi:hypothetical protein